MYFVKFILAYYSKTLKAFDPCNLLLLLLHYLYRYFIIITYIHYI